MNYVVISDKGGVGKTTFAIQVLAPYLYKKLGTSIPFYMADENNRDAIVYTKSEVLKCDDVSYNYLKSSNSDFFKFLSAEDHAIIDVGCVACEKFLKELQENCIGEEDNFTFFIPTLSDTQSVTNAVKTYLNLQKISENFKTCFVLSQAEDLKDVEVKIQFHRFFDYKLDLKKNYICVPESELFADSRDYKMTVFEIAKLAEKASENYKKLVKENRNLPREEFLEKTSSAYDNKIFSARCKVLVENELAKTFEQLDKELGDK